MGRELAVRGPTSMRTPEGPRVQQRAATAVRKHPDINGGKRIFRDCAIVPVGFATRSSMDCNVLRSEAERLDGTLPPKAKATRSNRVGCAISRLYDRVRPRPPLQRGTRAYVAESRRGVQTDTKPGSIAGPFSRSRTVAAISRQKRQAAAPVFRLSRWNSISSKPFTC